MKTSESLLTRISRFRKALGKTRSEVFPPSSRFDQRTTLKALFRIFGTFPRFSSPFSLFSLFPSLLSFRWSESCATFLLIFFLLYFSCFPRLFIIILFSRKVYFRRFQDRRPTCTFFSDLIRFFRISRSGHSNSTFDSRKGHFSPRRSSF